MKKIVWRSKTMNTEYLGKRFAHSGSIVNIFSRIVNARKVF